MILFVQNEELIFTNHDSNACILQICQLTPSWLIEVDIQKRKSSKSTEVRERDKEHREEFLEAEVKIIDWLSLFFVMKDGRKTRHYL